VISFLVHAQWQIMLNQLKGSIVNISRYSYPINIFSL
jgi:hypothetical protein